MRDVTVTVLTGPGQVNSTSAPSEARSPAILALPAQGRPSWVTVMRSVR